jgi:hypothetical protein
VVITVSVTFELPAAAILELFWDRPPVPIVSHPVDRWCAISSVDLKEVEAWHEAESAHCHGLPEADPFDDATILIDRFTLLEAQRGVRVHRWGLNEGLELITRMCRCSLDTDNALNRLLTKDRVSKSARHVRELLIIAPLNFPLVALVVIIMTGSWPVGKSLLVVNLLGLGEPFACRLSPSVVELKVDVVQM